MKSAIILLLAASAASAAQPLPIIADVSVTRDDAQRLAAIVLPREDVIATRLPRFEATYAERLKADARIAALEKAKPGIAKAVATAAKDEAAKGYGKAIDLLQADVAGLYRSKFDATELKTLTAFFSSPTGQALIAMSASSSGDIASAFEADRRAKALAYFESMNDEAKADLAKLVQSGLLPKVRAINPEVSALSMRRFEDVNNIIETALPARIEATIAAYEKAQQ